MQTNSWSEGLNIYFVIQVYPISDFASSADLRFQTLTGDAEFRWAVRPDMCLFLWNRISSIFFSKREFMGVKFGKSATSWAYQYNLLQHGQVLRMLLRFGWCSKGPMLGMLYASSFQRFSSKIFIRMPALMDRILSTQWHHLATEDAFAEELIAYWLSFVRSCDPIITDYFVPWVANV